MSYRLGLDVGTASCGLVAWRLDEHGRPAKLAYQSLDIWSEPLLPPKSGGVGQPKKAARRAARMMRRMTYRRARRLRRIAHLASSLGLDTSALVADKRNGERIHRLRAQAAENRVDLADLLRVLLHLAKNRGPSGDWVYVEPQESPKKTKKGKRSEVAQDGEETVAATETDKKAAEDKKTVVGGVRMLESLMQEAAQALGKNDLTLGQYLGYRRQRGEGVVLGKPEVGLYPSRRMVEREFNHIWDVQARFHPVLQNPKIRGEFFEAIFHQRALKSPAPMVGRCPLEPTLPRAPVAQMVAQAFRIEKQIADLRWGIGRNAKELSPDQKAVVRDLLNEHGEVSFKDILSELEKTGCPSPQGRGLNMDRVSRESLKGNTTLAAFRKLGCEEEWKGLDDKTQIQVINFLADLGSPDALDNDDWHLKFETNQKDPATGRFRQRNFAPELVRFINMLRAHPKFGRLSTMGFNGGRMAYSVKALKKLAALMLDGCNERAAIDQAYPERFESKQTTHELPLPPKTGNTVVDVALRQVYRAVRQAISTLGDSPAQVIVELSRDMALGIRKRGDIELRNKKNKKARESAAKEIKRENEPATETNIQRYLLLEEQSGHCPYCGQVINLRSALDATETERDHILPRTLTRVGGKRSQLVLVHRACNQRKGDRTPYLAFGRDSSIWPIIRKQAEAIKKKNPGKARLLLLEDWDDEVLDDATIKGFSDRQFHESSWIAKLTAQWLRDVCADVSVSRGELTAYLRRIWKLDTVIPEVRYATKLPVLDREGKPITREEFERHRGWWEGHSKYAGGIPTDRKPDKRIDHRHHLVDALVISLTDRSLFKKMAENYKQERERERRGERGKLSLYESPPIPALRDVALTAVTNATIRHKPDRHPDGPLFDQTAYGISRKPNDEGKHLLALSKPLNDLIDNKGSIEKTRRSLQAIESETTRVVVLQAFDRRIDSGKSLKQVFDEPILHPEFGTPIKRVRLRIRNSADTAAIVTHTDRHGRRLEKRYPHAGNAYLEISDENGKLKPRLVNVQEAMREKGWPARPGVTRFWKGDTVKLKDGSLHVVGQITQEAGGKLCLVPVTEACVFEDLKKRGLKLKTKKGKGLAEVQLVNV